MGNSFWSVGGFICTSTSSLSLTSYILEWQVYFAELNRKLIFTLKRDALDTVKDFLIELDMKLHIHLEEISIFHWMMAPSDLTKLWTEPKNLGTFLENEIF